MKEALLWDNDGDGVRCNLCAHRCRVVPNGRGRCAVRVNKGGALYSRVYGRVVAQNVDPIEKKPLYHFLPGSETFSIATIGCNFKCVFCQNHSISQALEFIGGSADAGNDIGTDNSVAEMSPEAVVNAAIECGCPSVSFTYTEPTVFFEYALDAAKAAKAAGLRTVFVSNGYMTAECLRMAAPYLDACNIDLKSFRDGFYRERCGARLAPVLESLRAIKDAGIWLEVTTLVIERLNDSDEELSDIARFVAGDLGVDTPWHVSGFYPRYRMSGVPPTGAASIERACGIGAGAGLRYVYGGGAGVFRDTRCPVCGAVVMRRRGYRTDAAGSAARGGACGACGEKLRGVF